MSKVVDLQYFGNSIYYLNLNYGTHVVFDQYVSYNKRNFSNRCIIAGANGPLYLTVPLKKGRTQRTVFKDVLVANEENWQVKHWKSIVSCYSGSPWFGFYADSLSALYTKIFRFLLDWNLACLDWSLMKLNLDVKYGLTSEYKSTYPEPEIGDNSDVHFTKAAGETGGYIYYKQIFEEKTGFIPNLSILDLLFCEGPSNTRRLLQRL
ncbi:MAG: WbqC family protein [Chitinophagaceae bacterium]